MEILSDVFGKKYKLYDSIKVVNSYISIVGTYFSPLKIFLFSFFSLEDCFIRVSAITTVYLLTYSGYYQYASIMSLYSYLHTLLHTLFMQRSVISSICVVSSQGFVDILRKHDYTIFGMSWRIAAIHNRLFKAQTVNYSKCHSPPTTSFIYCERWHSDASLMHSAFTRKHPQAFLCYIM